MKKALILFLTLIILSFTSCACRLSSSKVISTKTPKNNHEDNSTKKETQYTVADFMPQELNLKISFSGGFENGGETSFIDYVKGNKVQIRTDNGGTVMVTVLEKKDDCILTVFKQGEFYEKKNVIDKISVNPEVYLKGPIKVGTNWKASDGTVKTITSIDTELNTEAGKFKCTEVTSKGTDFIFKEYFTPKLGRISSTFTTNGCEFKTEIKSITK